MSFFNKTRQSSKHSVKNGVGFPEQPPELQLYPVGEHLISPVLTFCQMRCNPIGGWTFEWGNVVNIPVDIAHTVQLLPQNLSDTQTVALSLSIRWNIKMWILWKHQTFIGLEGSILFDAKQWFV